MNYSFPDDVPGGTILPPIAPRRRLTQLRRWLRWLFRL